jgi:hypothetical protein
MKNILLKKCLTGLALFVAGLAHAQDASGPVKIFTPQLMSHAVISGAALSIAADSVVDGDLAAQAAVAIGAGANTQTQNIYTGAAVTTGALSTVKNIFAGAAAGIGAGAHANNIHAGAAIAVGAAGMVNAVYHGGALTLGAGAGAPPNGSFPDELDKTANEGNSVDGVIRNITEMATALAHIKTAQEALTSLNNSQVDETTPLLTTMGSESLNPGVWEGTAVTIAAGATITFDGTDDHGPDNTNTHHVWVMNLSEALTVGAGSYFLTSDRDADGVDIQGHTHTVIWNVGGAVTLGAGTEFLGSAFVSGAFNAATSDVSCGNIYAAGAVSVASIGTLGAEDDGNGSIQYLPRECDTNANSLAAFQITDTEYSLGLPELPTDPGAAPVPVVTPEVCPLWNTDEKFDAMKTLMDGSEPVLTDAVGYSWIKDFGTKKIMINVSNFQMYIYTMGGKKGTPSFVSVHLQYANETYTGPAFGSAIYATMAAACAEDLDTLIR